MVEAVVSRALHEDEIAKRDAQNKRQARQIEKLEKQLHAVLLLLKFGKSERHYSSGIDPNQLALFASLEVQQESTSEEEEEVSVTSKRRKPRVNKHPGRAPLPDHLERREQIIEPDLDPAYEWEKIGEDRSEILEQEPGELYVRVIVRPKYKKRSPTQTNEQQDEQANTDADQVHQSCDEVQSDDTDIIIAELPSRPIQGSYAGTGLLTSLIIAKLIDHLPFYRQIQRYDRNYGVHLSASTINSWFVAVCTLIKPLYEVLLEQTLNADYLQADESRIEVLTTIAKDKDGNVLKNKRRVKSTRGAKIRRGWMWVVHDVVGKNVVFNFEPGRGKADANRLLNNYTGYLQVDGYSAYNYLMADPRVIYIACTAHVRRKFFESLKNDRKRAEYALGIFKQIYSIDRTAKEQEMTAQQRHAYRLDHLQPLLKEFKEWLNKECEQVIPKSKIANAIGYAQNRFKGMENILLDGRLEMDNNLIENLIRPLALGRKNYLFAGSHAGAQRLAMMYSFFGSCKLHKVNPYQWLYKVLDTISDTKRTELAKLLPGKLEL